jgi:hypothetical protein
MARRPSRVRQRSQFALAFFLLNLLRAELGEFLDGHVDHALFAHDLDLEHASFDRLGEFVYRFELRVVSLLSAR